MRIHQVLVRDYRGVAALLRWEKAVVLFGRNDVGKSNILDAVALSAGLESSRGDPLSDEYESDELDAIAVVELEELEADDSPDRQLLASLLQRRHVPPLFPYSTPDEPRPDPQREQDLWGGSLVLSQFPASLLRWSADGSDEEPSRSEFKIGCVGPMYSADDPVNTIGSLEDVREELRVRARVDFSERLAELEGNSPGALAAFEFLLERCLHSRWLLCTLGGGTLWLPPLMEQHGEDVRERAQLLAAASEGGDPPIVGGFVRQVLDEKQAPLAFLEIEGHAFQPWSAVRVAASAERLADLGQGVEGFVRDSLSRVLYTRGDIADEWLERNEQGAIVISGAVTELCRRLSEHATAIAPRFVTEAYDIRIEPLEQVHWHKAGGRRIRLALARREGDDSFDLAVAGSGLAVWGAIAIEEAVRELDRELAAELSELLSGTLAGEALQPLETEPGFAPREEPEIGEQTRLYVVDEPERHLHLQAQEQAARWLTTRMGSGAAFLVATHSLAFLSLSTDDAEYALVSRGRDHLTVAESITHDVWGALDARASQAGLGSRAQLFAVARSFLIVEGEHDELVMRHFYSDMLDLERLIILPVRGAKNVRLLIEAEMLTKVDVPLIVLFDEIRAQAVVSAEPPSRKDVAAYAVWEMLQNWPTERRQPHVVEYVLPDIYCALPESCVQQVVRERKGSFPGWDRVTEAFADDESGRGFKKFFLRESGLSEESDTTVLLKEILDRCRLQPQPELARAMQEVVERARATAGLPPKEGSV